jgi:copper(I)-binding protein
MFMDLTGGLKEGEGVKGTLVFEKAGTVEVHFHVGGIGAQASPQHRH